MVEKRMLGITFAVKKFHQFIYGRKNVSVYTDHKPLITIVKKEVHKNTNRLQRLQLKLLKYDLDVKYLPGKEMLIADILSRDCNNVHENYVESNMTDFVHSLSLSDYLPLPDHKLNLLKKCTKEDDILNKLMYFIKSGWPQNTNLIDDEILKYYFKSRNCIHFKAGLLFFNDKIIIPKSLRKAMLYNVHGNAHLGIVKSKSRARSTMYWPNMTRDIESYINSCKTCKKFSNNNTRNMLISSELPRLPFQHIALDIGEYNGKNYLILEDYYSKYLDIISIANKSIKEIVHKLKQIFSNHGVPLTIRSDNSPFNCNEFKEFALDWGFTLNTSSPYYPKSNGLAEKGVGIAKQIIKKVNEENTCLYKALLEYRSSQLAHMPYTPSQLLMSRIIRNNLPICFNQLKPKIIPYHEILTYSKRNKDNNQQQYNPCKNREIKFKMNDRVWVKNFKRNFWEEAVIVDYHVSPRSYLVRNKDGKIFRRNVVHLKKRPIRQSSVGNIPHSHISTNNDNVLENDDLLEIKRREVEVGPGPVVTRYGRVSQKPDRLGYT
jgi:hypothetical protein